MLYRAEKCSHEDLYPQILSAFIFQHLVRGYLRIHEPVWAVHCRGACSPLERAVREVSLLYSDECFSSLRWSRTNSETPRNYGVAWAHTRESHQSRKVARYMLLGYLGHPTLSLASLWCRATGLTTPWIAQFPVVVSQALAFALGCMKIDILIGVFFKRNSFVLFLNIADEMLSQKDVTQKKNCVFHSVDLTNWRQSTTAYASNSSGIATTAFPVCLNPGRTMLTAASRWDLIWSKLSGE